MVLDRYYYDFCKKCEGGFKYCYPRNTDNIENCKRVGFAKHLITMRENMKQDEIKEINEVKSFKIHSTYKYKLTKDGVICLDAKTAVRIWGSSISIGDLKRNITDLNNGTYLITWDQLRDRDLQLRDRKYRTTRALQIIGSIYNQKRLK